MTIGFALAIGYTLGWILLYLIRAESIEEALGQYTRYERLAVVISPVLVSVHVSMACLMLSFASEIPYWAASVSTLIFAAALGFWVWARAMIAPFGVRRLPDQVPLRLKRHGAFGIVRNPLYFAVLVALAAPLVVLPRWSLGVSFALCCAALATRALQDEARLRKQLGAPYDAYCGEVKRLVPFFW